MIKEFRLPELGENIDSADIVKVTVSPGDKIEENQIILEIETDKATIEVPSDFSGTVKDVFVKEGDTAKVGQAILSVDTQDSNTTGEISEKSEKKESVKEKQITPKEEKVEQPSPAENKNFSNTIEFKLPELGENIESAQVVGVLVKPGTQIKKDQILFEIETDKATIEVPSDINGIVKEVKINEGETAKVGDVVLIIETTAPINVKEEKTEAAAPEPETRSVTTRQISGQPEIKKMEEPVITPQRINMPDVIAPAAPSVRRFAREIGIDINQVKGSGPGGRISINDVKTFAKRLNESIKKGTLATGIGIKQEKLPDFTKWGEISKEPMSNVRRKTAEHLSYAWTTVPHVTQFDKADITELEKLRKQYSKKVEALGGRLTITSILLKIVASALKKFPQFNTSIDLANNEIIYKKYFNVGVAVDTDRGLIVPVVKDVDKKSIFQLSVELSEISEKARNKKTTIEEMQGGNFTISNLGGIGGTAFTPIVNSPEVAILGVSRGSFEPVFIDGEFKPRLILPLSLSYDHRIIDGADAARFLRWICAVLEQPMLLILD